MRWFLKSLFIVIVLLVIVAAGVGFYFVKQAPNILAKALSKQLDAPVEVDKIDFTMHSITIYGLRVGNEPGSILPNALTVDTIIIEVPLIDFLEKSVDIHEVILNRVYLGFEFDTPKSPTGNWTRLVDHLYTQSNSTEASDPERVVNIDQLVVHDINSQVVYKTEPEKIYTLDPIPEMVFTNISTEGGIPLDQITDSVLGHMLYSVFKKHNINNMLRDLTSPRKAIKKLLSPLQSLNPFHTEP